MRNKSVSILLVMIGYCIPFSFLGMYGDAAFGSMWLYALTIFGYGFLYWLNVRYYSLIALLLGNALSCGSSVVCIELFQSEKWAWYFNPFTAVNMAIVISILLLIIQLVIWSLTKNRNKSKRSKAD